MAGTAGGRRERPTWSERMRAERAARGWSQADAVRALQAHAGQPLPGTASLLRNWKRWEAGDAEPDGFHKRLVAAAFGTVTAAFFPPSYEAGDAALRAAGMDTLELLGRLRASDVSRSTLDGVAVTADRLACEYPYAAAERLYADGRAWLGRITALLDGHLTLGEHREVLTHAGRVALLLGCVEYDLGRRADAEATRRAALSLGEESGHAEIVAWAHEMRAWFALTQGNYHAAIAAALAGEAAVPDRGVTVQLMAQRAKAWARIGDRRQVEVTLDAGRRLLDAQPYPVDLDNHFVVDPAKYDFYAMDCYRMTGEDRLAEVTAHEVIVTSTDVDGTARKPMRIAQAELTLGVVAARKGDLEEAVDHGRRALASERRSLPSLRMASAELAQVLRDESADAPVANEFHDELRSLALIPRDAA